MIVKIEAMSVMTCIASKERDLIRHFTERIEEIMYELHQR